MLTRSVVERNCVEKATEDGSVHLILNLSLSTLRKSEEKKRDEDIKRRKGEKEKRGLVCL